MKNIEYIFTDFDGTITKYDVISRFISTFSKGDYKIAEKEWCEGKISSKECFTRQFKMIDGLSCKKYHEFINSVEIDPYFFEFYELMKSKEKKIIVVSDGVDAFIEPVLKRHNISLPIFSNSLKLIEVSDKYNFEINYPNINKNCKVGLGCCKCEISERFTKSFVYIGDGLSDRCIAKKAKFIFAKKSLKDFCTANKMKFIPFETFREIINAYQA